MLSSNIVFYCLASLVLSARNTGACNQCDSNCPTGDCIPLDITQQSSCTQVVSEGPTYDCRWYNYGLARHVDQLVNNGTIYAYQIQWSSGAWTGWYVVGVNDIDCKYNTIPAGTCNDQATCGNSLRRMWSYFYDHTHTYIICYNHW